MIYHPREVYLLVAVDPDSAGVEGVADTNRSVEILGVNGSSEAVHRVIAQLKDLFLGLELGDGADRSEDLFLHDLCVLFGSR